MPTDIDSAPSVLKGRLSYNRYGGYFLPESSLHRPAAQAVLNADVYEPKTIEFMRKNCETGDIVHAGTYFGDFLPALSSACTPNAKIWAFEPNEENYRCAQITSIINKLENVILLNAGLGDKDENLYIRTKDELGRGLGGASSIIEKSEHDATLDQEVSIVTIDNVVPNDRYVSILQLDVEGHEQSALAGALKTIIRCRPIIILEVWSGSVLLDSDWFASSILSIGYKRVQKIHQNIVFRTNS